LQLDKGKELYMVGSSSPIILNFMFANSALLRIRHSCCAWRPYCNMKNTVYTIMTFTTLRHLRHYYFIRHFNIYFMNLINNKEVTRYLFKTNQAIFSGSRETASTLYYLTRIQRIN
jgi:hypothetical protein